jgi:hypothetical protein
VSVCPCALDRPVVGVGCQMCPRFLQEVHPASNLTKPQHLKQLHNACWIVHHHIAQQSASCVLQPGCSSCAAITAPQAARSRGAKELMLSCSSMAAEWSRVFFCLPLAVADSWTSHSLRGDGLFRTKPTEPCSGSASNQHHTLLL